MILCVYEGPAQGPCSPMSDNAEWAFSDSWHQGFQAQLRDNIEALRALCEGCTRNAVILLITILSDGQRHCIDVMPLQRGFQASFCISRHSQTIQSPFQCSSSQK